MHTGNVSPGASAIGVGRFPRVSGRAQLPVGLLVGAMLDAIVPDPRVGHPVAGFGAVATAVEGRIYADSRVRGLLFAAGCVAATAATGAAIERRAGRYTRAAAIAAGTWTVLGARSLRHEARAVHELLTRGDLDGARARVTHLVGRDPSVLDADGVARAAVESVAENSCDAVVAPLLWGAIGGLPGLLGYRAINTLDAMVGHRTPRYANFGWAAARLDDIANVVPARVTALLVALAAPAVGGDGRAALRTALRDGRRHPSPNSGFSEAAYAGALALRLGGPNVYAGGTEDRPHLGDGAAPTPADVPRAARLCAAVTASAALFAAGVAVARARGVARPRGGAGPRAVR
jgi:adenosylcobinamide-phosphate synthase